MKLQSYVADTWIAPEGALTSIASAVTGDTVAETGATVRNFKALLDHARNVGGAVLRKMTFHQRAKMLKALGDAVMAKKDELYELSLTTLAPPKPIAGSTSKAARARCSPIRPKAAANCQTTPSSSKARRKACPSAAPSWASM
jgi:acyl-CoA reductase-like NAD-dependent aldehyde dehydrogenase